MSNLYIMSAKIMKEIQTKQKPNDIVYTPQKIVDLMIEDININDSILDPCYGKGVFYNSFKNKNKHYCEITKNLDFFDFNENIDLIYGNPPYSLLTKWLEHSFKICNKKIKYIIGMYSLTPARLTLAEKYGFYITDILLTQVPTWFQRSYIITFEKLKEKPLKINFNFINLGNKCLYCNLSVGGMKGHCKRKMCDTMCSY